MAGWWDIGFCESLLFPLEEGWHILKVLGPGLPLVSELGGNEAGVEARRASLCSCLVPRCSWAPAQMQLEDGAAAK